MWAQSALRFAMGELRDGIPQVPRRDDVVPAQHRRSLVAGQLHRDVLADSSPDQISHRRASEVVDEFAGQACLLTGGLPRVAIFLDLPPVPAPIFTPEDPWNDL